MALPLAGIRVLDLTNVIAGPLASYQLALMGAEVIKVEVPGIGDLSRKMGADVAAGRRQMGTSYLAFNSNKKSITLNLKSERGKDVFRRLAKQSDVVLENFRPGAMERPRPVGGAVARAQSAKLIYCAISGFGQTGPLAERASYDQIIQGYCRLDGVDRGTGNRPREGRSGCLRHHRRDHRRLRHRRRSGPAQRDSGEGGDDRASPCVG